AYVFIQQSNGTFRQSTITTNEDRAYEDAGLLLFDADGDGDLDLYAVSGSYEFGEGDARLQDRLYRNDGKGRFLWDPKALPEETSSGSCVRQPILMAMATLVCWWQGVAYLLPTRWRRE